MESRNHINLGIRNAVVLLLLSIFISGCGETLKSSWDNFRAYYNTYYNAEKNFRAGLRKVQEQPVDINPEEPIRAHPAPVKAGYNDFQDAIDKGAQILRKFPDSKYVDDALLLIGKSYYYRQEFYPALQKFEELRSGAQSAEMEQLAIIWKARAQLDINQHTQAISFMEAELEAYPTDWSAENKAEMRILLAQHYAMLERWEEADQSLTLATIPDLEKRQLLGRTYFLHGQILERLERYGEASFILSKVSESFPDYEYVYWAEMKRADVMRKQGNMDLAISIYDKLRRDDKNFERIDRINYEIARTLEMQGKAQEAEKRYKNLLYSDDLATGGRSLQGEVYYRLGKIYSESYNKLSTAAAYFDTASTYGSGTSGTASIDAQSLSKVYSEYERLRKEIEHADSLLRLGSLSSSELDSVLDDLRQERREQLTEREKSESQNRLVNRNLASGEGENTSSSIYGFLNHRNSDLVKQAKSEFRLLWGNRPLTDNWRRMEAVRQSRNESEQIAGGNEEEVIAAPSEEVSQLEMDVSAIPRTKEARNKVRVQKTNAQYRLGNLFFLNLSMPDSARYYFQKVIESQPDTKIKAQAMYSLYELYKTNGPSDSLSYWSDRLVSEYPDSRYARMVRQHPNGSDDIMKSDSLRRQYQMIINAPKSSNTGAALRQLALENRSSEMASHIYYRAIEEYIKKAKTQRKLRDSLLTNVPGILMRDSLANTDILADSIRHERGEQIAFKSTYWDSVRMVLHEFDTTFTNASQRPRVTKLREILDEQRLADAEMSSCKQLDISPNMNEFLSKVSYPEKLDNSSFSGEISYLFVITKDGEISSYQLESNNMPQEIQQAFDVAIEEFLRFKPLQRADISKQIRCTVSFPLQQ